MDPKYSDIEYEENSLFSNLEMLFMNKNNMVVTFKNFSLGHRAVWGLVNQPTDSITSFDRKKSKL